MSTNRTINMSMAAALGLGLLLAQLWALSSGYPDVHAQGPDGHSVYYVAPSCTGVPTPCYTTIQAAVDAADGPGDVIKVTAGTYTDSNDYGGLAQVVYITKTVTIRGGYTTAFTEPPNPDANPTTLDAGRQERVIYVTGNISPTLEGLRITAGEAAGLGGSLAGDSGGGVFVISATVTMSNNRVLSNTALVGGGLYFRNSTGTRLTNNLIRGNSTPQSGSGGGLYMDNSANVTLSGNTISNNEAGPRFIGLGTGGGVMFIHSPEAALVGNTIDGNRATYAGGLKFDHSPTATLMSNTISDNVADHAGGGMKYYGGVLFVYSDYATLMSNTISGNRAANDCGGVCFVVSHNAVLSGNAIVSNTRGPSWDGYGAGVYLSNSRNTTLVGNLISNNTAQGIGNPGTILGGGLYIGYNSSITLISNTITFNGATQGGGLCVDSGSIVALVSSMITGNVVYDSCGVWCNYDRGGGGLYLNGGSIATLTNTIIADNRAETSGSGLYIAGSSLRLLHATIARNGGGDGSGVYVTNHYGNYSTVALTNTILVSHTVGITVATGNTATLEATLWGTDTWANETDWGGAGTVITGTCNYWGDPDFMAPEAGNYHIGSNSAAIDRGVDAGVITDIDGDPRPVDGDLDGTALVDLGVDEFALRHIYLPVVLRQYQ